MSRRSANSFDDGLPPFLDYDGTAPDSTPAAQPPKGISVRGLSKASFAATFLCAIFLALAMMWSSPHRLDSLDIAMSAMLWGPVFILGALLWTIAASASLARYVRKKKLTRSETRWLLIAAVAMLCLIGSLFAVPSHRGVPGGW
jgi:hypothetical protein